MMQPKSIPMLLENQLSSLHRIVPLLLVIFVSSTLEPITMWLHTWAILTYETTLKTDYLMVGDGKLLPITQLGPSILPANHAAQSLKLNDILLVPQIAKNLLSVSKLSWDNNFYLEFHPNCCFVRPYRDKFSSKEPLVMAFTVSHLLLRQPNYIAPQPPVLVNVSLSSVGIFS